MRTRAVVLLAAVGGLLSGEALASPALREFEPVIVEGARLSEWAGDEDLTRIGLFRYETAAGTFVPIPFQIDKRRKIYVNRNMPQGVPASFVDVCEYGYFREKRVAAGSADDRFASNVLAATDEVVFLWKDAGDRASVSSWPNDPQLDDDRYEITLTDSNNGGSRWVYAFLGTTAPPQKSATKYVRWTSDAGSENCVNGLDSCGTAEGIGSAMPATIPVQRVHFQKNWLAELYAVAKAASFLPTLVSRFEYTAGIESEDTWSVFGNPVFDGVYVGEQPVRIVRQVQGAQSGTHTTRYDFIYPATFVTRVNLRVHPLPDLLGRLNHDAAVASTTPATRVWAKTGFEKATPEPRDVVDGNGPMTDQVDATRALYLDWTQVATPDRGGYAHLYREVRPPSATLKNYTYRDEDNSPKIGSFGRSLTAIGMTQDGAFPSDYTPCPGCLINDGGCVTNDPESASLNFARFEWTLVPLASVADPGAASELSGDDVYANALRPLTIATRVQERHTDELPPLPPCDPQLAVLKPSAHGTVELEVDTSNCASGSGYRLFRAGEDGTPFLLRDLGTQVRFRDLTARVGESYTYFVRAYNEVDAEGRDSAGVRVTVADLVAPATPARLVVAPADGGLSVSWQGGTDRDLRGYDVSMSTDGDPFVRANSEPIPAWAEPRWSPSGLKPGRRYCFTVSAVDLHGNASSASEPVCGTPQGSWPRSPTRR